jgi:hypothetical protein
MARTFDFNMVPTPILERIVEVGGDPLSLTSEEYDKLIASQEKLTAFDAGMATAKSSLSTAVAAGLNEFGYNKAAESSLRAAKKYQSELKRRYQPEVPSIMDEFSDKGVLSGIAALPQFTYEQLALSAPQLVATLGAGIAGTALGGPGVGLAAAVSAGTPFFTGQNIQRQMEDTGVPLDDVDVTRAFGTGVAQSAADVVIGRYLGVFGKTQTAEELAKSASRGLANRVARAGGKGALVEAPTEALQQVLEIAQADPDAFFDRVKNDPAIRKELYESAIAGGLIGGAITAPTGIIKPTDPAIAINSDLEAHLREETEESSKMSDFSEIFDRAEVALSAADQRDMQLAQDRLMMGDAFPQAQARQARADAERRQVQSRVDDAVLSRRKLEGERVQEELGRAQDRIDEAVLGRGRQQEDSRVTMILDDLAQRGITSNEARAAGLPARTVEPDPIPTLEGELVPKESFPAVIDQDEVQARQRLEDIPIEGEFQQTENILTADENTSSPFFDEDGEFVPNRAKIYAEPTAKQRGTLEDRLAGLEELSSRAQQPSIEGAESRRIEQIRSGMVDPFNDPEFSRLYDKLTTQEAKGLTGPATKTRNKLKEVMTRLGVTLDRAGAILDTTPATRGQLRLLSKKVAQQVADEVRKSATRAATLPQIPEFRQKLADVYKALKAAMKQMGLSDVALRLDRIVPDPNGNIAEGVTESSEANNVLIALSTQIYDPSLTAEQLTARIREVMNHEVIHALRNFGVLTDAEYRSLVEAARKQKYVDRNGKERLFTYFDRANALYNEDGDSVSIKEEEAVAELFRDWAAGRKKITGKPKSLFQKIVKFFKTFGGVLSDNDINSPEKVFEGILSGRIGGRERGAPANRMQMFSRAAQGGQPAFYSATEQQIQDAIKTYSYNGPAGTIGYAVRMPIDQFMRLTYAMGPLGSNDVVRTAKDFLEENLSNDGSLFVRPERTREEMSRESFTRFNPEAVDTQDQRGIPMLILGRDEETGALRVNDHEGRHRTASAAIDGATTIPVIVRYSEPYKSFDIARLQGQIPRTQGFNYDELTAPRSVIQNFFGIPVYRGERASSYFEGRIPEGVPLDYGFEDQLSEVIGPRSDPLGEESAIAQNGERMFSRRPVNAPKAKDNPFDARLDRTIVPIYPESYQEEDKKKKNIKTKHRLTGDTQFKSNSVGLLSAAQWIQDRIRNLTGIGVEKIIYTDENIDELGRLMATEALKGLEQDNNAIGWYDEQMTRSKKILSIIEPRIFENDTNESAFDWSLAVTSNGQAVPDNFDLALQVFRTYLKDGRFPDTKKKWNKGGDRATAMRSSFNFFNQYQEMYARGEVQAPIYEFLDADFSVKELQKIVRDMNSEFGTDIEVPSGELVDTMVKGSFLAGPKIGQGFYQNLRGNFDPLTMDIWWMRMWNRLVNRPFKPETPKTVLNTKRRKAKAIIAEQAQQDKDIRIVLGLDEITFPNKKRPFKGALIDTGLRMSDLRKNETFDNFVPAFNRAWNRYYGAYKGAYGRPPEKSQIFKDMSVLEEDIFGALQGTPANGTERAYMRAVTNRAKELLKPVGVDINTADLQALLWYPEKRLFEALGVRKGQGQDTDYAESALGQAKKEGISDEQIQEALSNPRSGKVPPRADTAGDVSVIDQASRTSQAFSRRAPATSKIIEHIKNDVEGFTESVEGATVPDTGFVVAPVKEAELIVENGRVSEEQINSLVLFAMDLAQTHGIPVYVGGWLDSETNQYYLDAVTVYNDRAEAVYMANAADQLAIWDLGNSNEIITEQAIEELNQSGVYSRGQDNVIRGSQKQYRRYFDTFRNRRREELLTGDGRRLQRTDRGAGTGLSEGVALSNYPVYAKGAGPESGRSSFYGAHYTNITDLDSLDSNKHGSGMAGEELLGGWRPRLYFYRQSDGNLPRPEMKLEVLNEGYGARFTNIYDSRKDDFLVKEAEESGPFNRDLFEDLVEQAGYDGYMNHGFASDGAFVLLGEQEVPVIPVMTNKKTILNSSIDPATKRPMYSRRFSANAPNIATPNDIIDRMVGEKPPTKLMSLFNKYILGAREGETAQTAFIRNYINKFEPLFQIDNLLNGKLANFDPADSVGRAAELSQGVTGRAYHMLTSGALQFNKETGEPEYIDSPDNKGLEEIFAPIGDKFQREYSAYAMARRELKLRAQKRRGFVNESYQDIVKLVSELEAKHPFFKDVHADYQRFNSYMVEFAKDAGVLDEQMAKEFQNMDYVPFYRLSDVDANTSEMDKALSSKAAKALKNVKGQNPFDTALEGGEEAVGDLYMNVAKNAEFIVMSSLKNFALQKTANALEKANSIGFTSWGRKATADDRGEIVTFYEKGVEQRYKISDPSVWAALASLDETKKSGWVNALASVAGIFRTGITIAPSYMAANLIRGKIDAYVRQGVPLSFTQTFKKTFDAFKDGDQARQLQLSTGMGGYTYGQSSESIGNTLKRNARIKSEAGGPVLQRIGDTFVNVVKKLEKVGEATEMAERLVLMDSLMIPKSENGPGLSRREASYRAMNLINYGRRGAGGGAIADLLVNTIIPTVPFLNARIQGLYKFAEDPQVGGGATTQALIEMYGRGLLVMAASTVMAGIAMQDERWDDEPLYEKVGNDIFYIGDYKVRIPRAFEVGAIFGTIPILTIDAIRKQDGDDLAAGMRSILLNTFAFNPIPQGIKPVIEIATNSNFFKGGELANVAIRRLPTELQSRSNTPELYKFMSRYGGGSLLNLSPIEIQQIVEGYTGSIGAQLIATADVLLADTSRPSGAFGTIGDVTGFSRFLKQRGEGGSKMVGEFYEMKRDIDQFHAGLQEMQRTGQTEIVSDMLKEKGAALGYRKQFARVSRQLSEINRQLRAVMNQDISPELKSERVRSLRAQKANLTRQVVTAAKKSGYFD